MPYFKEGAEDAVAGRLFQQQQGDRLAVGLEEKRKNDKRINPETAFRGVDSGKNRPGDPGSFDISSIEEKLGKLFDNKKSDAKSQEEKDKYEQAKNEINTEDYIKDFFDSHIGWSPEAFTNALIEDLGLDSSDQNLVQTVQELLNNYTIGIEEYSKIFLEGTKAMAEATQQTAAALVASTDDINSAEYGDVLQDKAVQMISKTAEDTLDLLVGDDVNTRWKAKNEWESSHAAGLKDYKFKGFTDEGMQYTYTENGETKTATAEWSELAGAVAMSTENIGKFKDELVTMSGDLTTLDKVIDNTKTEEETKNSAKAVKNAIVEGNMDNLTYDELTNFATNNSTDKQKKQTTENLGLTGDYTEEIKQAIAVSSAAWDTLNGQARDFGIEIGNLTQKQAQIYIDITEDIMSAGSKISEQRSNMVDYNDPNLSLKEKEAAMDEENALRNAEAKLRDFSDSLRALSESPEFDTILENLNKLGISADDIINGNIKTIEDFGGSAEQYSEYLENMTNAAEKFADATHQIDSDGILTEDEAKELGVTTEAFENYVDQVYEAEQANKDLSKEQKRSKKAIAEQYEETLEAAKALEDLSDVFKKYDKELSNGSGIEDYGAAVAEMKEPLSELLKIDASKLSNDFFDPTNIQLMRDALNGSAEAIDQLRLNAAEDIYMQIHPELSPEEVTAQIGSLQEYLNGLDTKFDVNGELHDEGVIAGLQSMLANMNLTVGEAKEIMAGLGYSMEVESDQSEVTDTQETPDSYEPVIEDVPVTMGTVTGAPPDQQASTIEYTVPKVTYRPISGEETTSTKTTTGMATTVTANDGELLSSGHVKIKSLKKTPVSGNAVQAARPTVGNNSSSSPKGKNPSGGNSGGGGGSDKKKKPFVKETIEKAEKRMKKLDEEKEKYFEINKQLEDQSTLLDRLNKKKDTMWGIGRIKAIQQENEAIKKNIELNKQKLSEAKWYAEDYKKQLINIGAMFDENGNIVNYDELVENNVNAYNNGQKEIEKWENYIKNTLGEKLYNLQHFKLKMIFFQKKEQKKNNGPQRQKLKSKKNCQTILKSVEKMNILKTWSLQVITMTHVAQPQKQKILFQMIRLKYKNKILNSQKQKLKYKIN